MKPPLSDSVPKSTVMPPMSNLAPERRVTVRSGLLIERLTKIGVSRGMEDQSRSPSASGTRSALGEASELISTFFSVSFGQ